MFQNFFHFCILFYAYSSLNVKSFIHLLLFPNRMSSFPLASSLSIWMLLESSSHILDWRLVTFQQSKRIVKGAIWQGMSLLQGFFSMFYMKPLCQGSKVIWLFFSLPSWLEARLDVAWPSPWEWHLWYREQFANQGEKFLTLPGLGHFNEYWEGRFRSLG